MERDVGHGCCSCVHYKLTMKEHPCKVCKKWSHWEDARPKEWRTEPNEKKKRSNHQAN